MRECIYCGRSLEKGEKCTCALSEAHRRAKESGGDENTSKSDEKAKKDAQKQAKKEQKQANKERRKAQRAWEKSNRTKTIFNNNFAGVWRDFIRLFVAFIKSPVETVMNPKDMKRSTAILFVVLEGVISGMSLYSVLTGAVRGPFGILGYMMGIRGMAGYNILKGYLLSALSGAVSATVMYFVYSGIFYVVNRWIFKQFTPYWEFIKRFVFAFVPFALVGAVGVVLGLFSQVIFVVLLICSLIGTVIITYEILKSVWYSKSDTKIIYTMMACIFVFLMILIYFINFA